MKVSPGIAAALAQQSAYLENAFAEMCKPFDFTQILFNPEKEEHDYWRGEIERAKREREKRRIRRAELREIGKKVGLSLIQVEQTIKLLSELNDEDQYGPCVVCDRYQEY